MSLVWVCKCVVCYYRGKEHPAGTRHQAVHQGAVGPIQQRRSQQQQGHCVRHQQQLGGPQDGVGASVVVCNLVALQVHGPADKGDQGQGGGHAQQCIVGTVGHDKVDHCLEDGVSVVDRAMFSAHDDKCM